MNHILKATLSVLKTVLYFPNIPTFWNFNEACIAQKRCELSVAGSNKMQACVKRNVCLLTYASFQECSPMFENHVVSHFGRGRKKKAILELLMIQNAYVLRLKKREIKKIK